MSGGERFARLMEPGRIGSIELRNRIVMCPMGAALSNADGTISDNEAAYYEARARGGAGLLLMGTTSVAYPRGTNDERNPAMSDDRYLPGPGGPHPPGPPPRRPHRRPAQLHELVPACSTWPRAGAVSCHRAQPRPKPDRLWGHDDRRRERPP